MGAIDIKMHRNRLILFLLFLLGAIIYYLLSPNKSLPSLKESKNTNLPTSILNTKDQTNKENVVKTINEIRALLDTEYFLDRKESVQEVEVTFEMNREISKCFKGMSAKTLSDFVLDLHHSKKLDLQKFEINVQNLQFQDTSENIVISSYFEAKNISHIKKYIFAGDPNESMPEEVVSITDEERKNILGSSDLIRSELAIHSDQKSSKVDILFVDGVVESINLQEGEKTFSCSSTDCLCYQ